MERGPDDSKSGLNPANAPDSADALWLPPRRRRGGLTTPLGFQAGHPCPRVCGGALEEAEGGLRCTGCDFRYPEEVRYPEEEAAGQPSGLADTTGVPDTEAAPASASLKPTPVSARPDDPDLVGFLLREVQRLREENGRMTKVVAGLRDEMARLREQRSAPAASDVPPDETQEIKKIAPWWRKG
ncbi:MAG: hypothetical protein KY468_19460 [Armatimonadetes bacterium]|nr:hypothetical protein [Armatimonadota bacterium]